MSNIKIKFTTSIAGQEHTYNFGETVELPLKEAKSYLQAGYAEPVEEQVERAVKKRKK